MSENIIDNISEPETKMKKFMMDTMDILSFVLFLVWVLMFIRLFLFSPFTVKGQSMQPNFQEWNFIVVDKIIYKYNNLQRWNIVVFVPTNGTTPFIKRIVWMPWEIVRIKDGEVHICKQAMSLTCTKLDEQYLSEDTITKASCGFKEFKVPDNSYLVFGDNRDHSTDSRCCFKWFCSGENDKYWVTKEEIIGKVYMEILPEFKTF